MVRRRPAALRPRLAASPFRVPRIRARAGLSQVTAILGTAKDDDRSCGEVTLAMGLGINKDLEPLAREVRRRGGTVTVTGSNHVRWSLGDWAHMTGLTMSDSSAHGHRRLIERHLASLDAPLAVHVVVGPTPRGKFEVHGADGPIRNGNGYPRTYSTRDDARRAARQLDLALQPGNTPALMP